LKFKCIINGCLSHTRAQAEELNGFISRFLDSEASDGTTIIFYSQKDERKALPGLVPTQRAELVRIDRYHPESILDALARIEYSDDADLYLFPSGFAGSEIAVRWAFRQKGSSLVQVKHIDCTRDRVIAKKTAYVDHVLATFRLDRRPFCLSPARGCVDRLPIRARDNLVVTEHDFTGLNKGIRAHDFHWIPVEHAKHFENPRFLIVGGRGLQNKENVQFLKNMADAVGAEFGISRAVALNAWGPMHRLIGVSGTIAKPEICIAAGVSGAAAFYAGIEKSKFIIAINTDPLARIIKSSDVVVIDDYKTVMAELLKFFTFDGANEA